MNEKATSDTHYHSNGCISSTHAQPTAPSPRSRPNTPIARVHRRTAQHSIHLAAVSRKSYRRGACLWDPLAAGVKGAGEGVVPAGLGALVHCCAVRGHVALHARAPGEVWHRAGPLGARCEVGGGVNVARGASCTIVQMEDQRHDVSEGQRGKDQRRRKNEVRHRARPLSARGEAGSTSTWRIL